MASFNITFTDDSEFNIGFTSGGDNIPVVFDTIITPPAYQGSYDITPTEETQVIQGKGLVLTDDITIAPIPTNYGRLTWNGSILTVS